MTGCLRCQPKIVIWDFNGTLLDDLHVAYASVEEIFRTYGIPCPTLEQYREEITADFMEFYYEHGFPRSTTGDELNVIRREYYRTHGNDTCFRPGVFKTTNRLLILGFHTAIVSAEISATLYKFLVRNGLQRKFDFIKPEAWGDKTTALLQAAEVFEIKPEEMIYVDDTVDGLTTAKNAGVVPVAFTNPTGYNSKCRLLEVTDASIKEVDEVIDLLKTA